MNYFVENSILQMHKCMESELMIELETHGYVLQDTLDLLNARQKDMVALSLLRERYSEARCARVKEVAIIMGLNLMITRGKKPKWKWN